MLIGFMWWCSLGKVPLDSDALIIWFDKFKLECCHSSLLGLDGTLGSFISLLVLAKAILICNSICFT